ncbi:TolC family protein [uncultured Desulfuromonas sp.]|uniref:TolC family protein n=1 Tax=uncultured Desulfuromonas sp. TaxID=181013 RepID=UPI002AAB7DCE|nr:TolC family protein [uncultured Desulfuromonas sp.]
MKHLILLGVMIAFLTGCSVTPQPLSLQEVEQRSYQDLTTTLEAQEPVSGPIDLYEAMARALKYNLEGRLKLMEAGLALDQKKVAGFDMLPKLVASAGYQSRDNYSGSSSMALEGPNKGRESLVSSTSQEKESVTSDITMMWNVLDFGLSYVRAKQEGDKVLIAEEHKRKTIQNILQQVRTAYWKAVSSEVLLEDMNLLLEETHGALERSRRIEKEGLSQPRQALEYQRSLLENIRFIKGAIQEMYDARTELARLMNISPSTPFTLVVPVSLEELPQLELDVESLERLAMGQRPELHEEDYRARITALEARKALLQAFPNLNLRAGFNTDTNSFLHNNQWWEAGARVSLNLFKLLSQPTIRQAIKSQQEVDLFRRQALSMAILTQVHLAYNGFLQSRDQFELSRQIEQINARLNALTLAERQSTTGNDLALIRSRTQALATKMSKMMTYAQLQQAFSQVVNTVGLDMLPDKVDDATLVEVKDSLQHSVANVEALLAESRSAE